MSRVATEQRFTSTWYNPPYPTTIAAAEASGFALTYIARAAWLHARYPTDKIAIAGTGFALTQYYLFTNHNRQSWGFDADWAAGIAKAAVGAAQANNVMVADATNATQMTAFRRLGNTGQDKYDILFTEDLLPCADTEAEAQLMLTRLRAVGTTLVHLISPLDTTTTQTPDMLWQSFPQWRTLIGPTELIVSPAMVEVP